MADGDDKMEDNESLGSTLLQGEPSNEDSDKKIASLKRTHDSSLDFCRYSLKPCKRSKLKGLDFCDKHILEDKDSPFQRCNFISKTTGTSCTNPAPKRINKKSFCLVHTRNPNLKKALALKMKKKKSKKSKHSGSKPDYLKGKPLQHSSKYRPTEQNECEEVFDSESPPETNNDNRIETTWLGDQETDSDSIDSDEEDPLKYAGVWTLEESMKILKDKMIRLRSLYEGQFKRVEYMLKDRRRKYLHDSMSSEGGCCSTNPDDIHNNKKLHNALKHYQKLTGQDAALEKQTNEKRTKGATSHSKPSYLPRCHHIISGQRCQAKSVPLSRFCLEHICYDPTQLLFKPCSIDHLIDSNENCESPVLHISAITVCDKHVYLPPLTSSEAVAATLEFPSEIKKQTSIDSNESTDCPVATETVNETDIVHNQQQIDNIKKKENELTNSNKDNVPILIMPQNLENETIETGFKATTLTDTSNQASHTALSAEHKKETAEALISNDLHQTWDEHNKKTEDMRSEEEKQLNLNANNESSTTDMPLIVNPTLGVLNFETSKMLKGTSVNNASDVSGNDLFARNVTETKKNTEKTICSELKAKTLESEVKVAIEANMCNKEISTNENEHSTTLNIKNEKCLPISKETVQDICASGSRPMETSKQLTSNKDKIADIYTTNSNVSTVTSLTDKVSSKNDPLPKLGTENDPLEILD